MFNYLQEYVQLPSGICLTTLGDLFNYPRECSTTLGDMFNYPGEYVQLPWGVCSNTRKTSGHWEAGGKAGGKAWANLGATP